MGLSTFKKVLCHDQEDSFIKS